MGAKRTSSKIWPIPLKRSHTKRRSARRDAILDIEKDGRVVREDRFRFSKSSDLSRGDQLLQYISDAFGQDSPVRLYERQGTELKAVHGGRWRLTSKAMSERKPDQAFAQFATKIAHDHGIKAIDAHYLLLQRIAIMHKLFRMSRELRPSPMSWVIPGWISGRRKLLNFEKRLWSMERPLRGIARDWVQRVAIECIDPDGRFQGLVAALVELAELVRAAAKIEGKSGRRCHPSWTTMATALCRQFWRDQMQAEPKPYFKHDATTQPANHFSRWFCDLLYAVATLTPSECKTILERK